MATVGAAGAVGVGTWAQSNDSEKQRVVVKAGGPQDDLDLKVGDQEGVIQVNAGTLSAEESFKACKTLSNAGSVPGKVVYTTIPKKSVRSEEGKNYEQETDTSGEGELDDYIYYRSYLAPEDTESAGEAIYFFYGDEEEYVPFDDVVFDRSNEDSKYGASVTLSEEDLEPIVDNQAYEYCFEVVYRPEDSQEALGDALYFDVEVVLSQGKANNARANEDNSEGKSEEYIEGYEKGYRFGYKEGYEQKEKGYDKDFEDKSEDYRNGYKKGYETGYDEGRSDYKKYEAESEDYRDGYLKGYLFGYEEGYEQKEKGYDKDFEDESEDYRNGYKKGYETGYGRGAEDYQKYADADAKKNENQDKQKFSEEYRKGYEKGYLEGYPDGYGQESKEVDADFEGKSDEYKEGYKKGYATGYDEGRSDYKQYKDKDEDYREGYKQGYLEGYPDAYEQKERVINADFSDKSEKYKQGYKKGYVAGYDRGNSDYEKYAS